MKTQKKIRNPIVLAHLKRNGNGAGPHHNREYDYYKGRKRHTKHKSNKQYIVLK